MDRPRILGPLLICTLLLGLAGCGTSGQSPRPNAGRGTAAFLPPEHGNWTMPSTVPAAYQHAFPEESPSPLNIPSPGYTFSTWVLPAKWAQYLYKSEPLRPISERQPQTLFITLQGTVFSYRGTAGRYWPVVSYDDIPPGAIILAEFVPLLPAVKDGVVPVYRLPIVGGLPLPRVWQRVLGLRSVDRYVEPVH